MVSTLCVSTVKSGTEPDHFLRPRAELGRRKKPVQQQADRNTRHQRDKRDQEDPAGRHHRSVRGRLSFAHDLIGKPIPLSGSRAR